MKAVLGFLLTSLAMSYCFANENLRQNMTPKQEAAAFFHLLGTLKSNEKIEGLLENPVLIGSYRASRQNQIDFITQVLTGRPDLIQQPQVWQQWFGLEYSKSRLDIARIYAFTSFLLESPDMSFLSQISESNIHLRFGLPLSTTVEWVLQEALEFENRIIEQLNSRKFADRQKAYLFFKEGPPAKLRTVFLKHFWYTIDPMNQPKVMTDLMSAKIHLWEAESALFLAKVLSEPRWQSHPEIVLDFIRKYYDRKGFAEVFTSLFLSQKNWLEARLPLFTRKDTATRVKGSFIPANNTMLVEQLMHVSSHFHHEILTKILSLPANARMLPLIEASLLIEPRFQSPEAKRISDPMTLRNTLIQNSRRVAEAQARLLSLPHVRLQKNWGSWMLLFLAKNKYPSAIAALEKSGTLRSPEFLRNSKLMTESLYNHPAVGHKTRKLWDRFHLSSPLPEVTQLLSGKLQCQSLFARSK